MSTKPKYKAYIGREGYFLVSCVTRGKQRVCETDTIYMARKIARALNVMEAKPKQPKAKPFALDWSGIESRYNFAAMDLDGQWYLFQTKPHAKDDGLWVCGGNFREIRGIKTYPGDWRDSLQKRP